MLNRLANIFRIRDLRGKVLFTLFVLALFRLGSTVPVPGVAFTQVQKLQQGSSGGVLSLLNLFSGGALTRLAVFGLGIMPNITASIIMQLLSVVIPKLEEWRDEGEIGQKKITQWTRYLTLVLALVQSAGFAYLFSTNAGQLFGNTGQNPQLLGSNPALWRYALVIIALTTGTVLVMWLGELITQRGIGNGMSLLIFASVVSRLPSEGASVKATGGNAFFVLMLLLMVAMVVGIVFIESGQRRIPVQFAKRVVGRKMTTGGATYIPLKVNTGGVIPVIFASSILYIPALFSPILPKGLQAWVTNNLQSSRGGVYIAMYFLLVIGFSYFYNMIQFDPVKNADLVKKQGGYIPGIRPGKPTADYFAHVLNRITFPGALYLATIAIIPVLVLSTKSIQNFPFGGTSILITVGVALETMKQIDSQLMMRNYEGFLKS